MSLTAIFERLDGTRIVRTVGLASEDDVGVLIPRRNILTGEIEETARYNKTEEVEDGLMVFRQDPEHDPKWGTEFFNIDGRN